MEKYLSQRLSNLISVKKAYGTNQINERINLKQSPLEIKTDLEPSRHLPAQS